MTANRRRISAKSEEETGKLQHLSVNQPVLTINRNKKRRRIYAKDEAKIGTHYHLSTMFPHDIMLDILSRLPVKPLIRFRSVSKSWNYLIKKDRFFINMHLSRSQIQPIDHEKIILVDNERNYCVYSLDLQESGRLERLIHHNLRHVRTEYNSIWGTCNGLICTGGGPDKDLYIWNPSTTEYRKIQCLNGGRPFSCYGFAYNSNANDYVLVEITTSYDDDCDDLNQFCSRVAIYSLCNDSWRSIGIIPYQVLFKLSGVLVNGSLHWVAQSKFISEHFLRYGRPMDVFDQTDTVLLAFEIASENFVEVPGPDYNDIGCGNVAVSQYQGKFCVFNDNRYINCDLWVMNDYGVRESWTKLFSFRKYVPDGLPQIIITTLFCCTKEGSILMIDLDGNISSYDPKHRTRFHIQGINTRDDAISSYIPSIVSLSFN